jgi:Alpha amylase, catalytic domain
MIPRATYRLQLTHQFGFDGAAELAPYLHRLGVSHAYFSPYLKARPGSPHGYDIVDHHQLNPELGDAASFQRLCAALIGHGLGHRTPAGSTSNGIPNGAICRTSCSCPCSGISTAWSSSAVCCA